MSGRMHVRRVAAAAALGAIAALLLCLAPAPVSPRTADAASGGACSSTTAKGGQDTVSVCLVAPRVAHGSVQIGATVTLSEPKTPVTYVTFCLDGSATGSPSCVAGGPGYLLRAFNALTNPSHGTTTWGFALPSDHWIDGTHTLLAVAQLGDGTQTQPATATLRFSNGNARQPVNSASPTFVHPTRPAPGRPLVVAAVGDGGGDDPASRAVAGLVSGWRPNLFLYLGDIYDQGGYAEFTNWYDPSFGSLRPITAPVPGNHEYMSSSDPATRSNVEPKGTAYFDYWNNLPNFYSFDAGGWHFVALNANPEMGTQRWQNQLDWLAADQASHASACTIAFWHEPAFNTGTAQATPEAKRLWSLVAGHATLVVNAHDHTYQRWAPMDATGREVAAGTAEIVAGTGGHQPTGIVHSDARRVADATKPGALRLELQGRTVREEFVATSGATQDATTYTCVRGGAGGAAAGGQQAQGAGAGGSASGAPVSGDEQRALEFAFVVAIVLAVASYFLARLPFAVPLAVLVAGLGALALAAGGHRTLPGPALGAAVLAVFLGVGWCVGRLVPRRAVPALLLGVAIAVVLAVVAAYRLTAVPQAVAPASGPGAVASAIGTTPLGAALLAVAAGLAVALAVHAARRGLPLAAAVVPTAVALVVAEGIALAGPHLFRSSVGTQWPALVAPLLALAWLGAELLLPPERTARES